MSHTTIFLLGGTSSLGLEFIKLFSTKSFNGISYRVLSFIRPASSECQQLNRKSFNYVTTLATLPKEHIFQTVEYDGTEEDLLTKITCVYNSDQKYELVNLSTYSFVNILKFAQTKKVPSFIIGSGAVIDWAGGRLKINDYVEGKLRAERESTTTMHPGFYIKDTSNDADSQFPWHGLHLETYKWMFADSFDETKDWSKKYYVTPMSYVIDILCKWIENPISGHFSVGSHKPLYRYQIRELSGLFVPQEIKDKYDPLTDIYEKDMEKTEREFGLSFSENTSAFVNAREWTKIHSKELNEYINLNFKQKLDSFLFNKNIKLNCYISLKLVTIQLECYKTNGNQLLNQKNFNQRMLTLLFIIIHVLMEQRLDMLHGNILQ